MTTAADGKWNLQIDCLSDDLSNLIPVLGSSDGEGYGGVVLGIDLTEVGIFPRLRTENGDMAAK
jgi:hypothetical protein